MTTFLNYGESELGSVSRKNGVNRRAMMRTGLAGVGLAVLPSWASWNHSRADEPSNDPVEESLIDAHVHVWTPDTKRYPLAAGFTVQEMRPASFTPAELLSHAKPAGVRRIVLIQMSYYGYDNSYMLQAMHDYQGVFSGVAIVDEHNQPCQHMKELAGKGVRGIRIQPAGRQPDTWLSSDSMRAMWKCGADEGLAMCHLINPEFLPSVERMCRRFPDTPVVIDHFARIGIDGVIRQHDLGNLGRLARYKNVSVKVSAYYALGKKQPPYDDLGPMIRQLLDAFGPERLMWASDCPFQIQGMHTYKASIDLIQTRLDFLTVADRQWLLQKTAERVFFS